MQAIIKQFDNELKKYHIEKKDIDTIFIGGGTPSTIQPELYEAFFNKIHPYLNENIEITIEANPNSATLKWIDGMKKLGINRISFGVQSFDKEKLKYLGRNHSPKDAIKAIENAHKIGIDNISLDLIHDTKIDSKKLLQNDIQIAKQLPINHISSYSLSIEKGAQFFKTNEKAKEDIDTQIWFYNKIEDAGFPRYEVSNFGTYICRHNAGYWMHKDYIGIGAGAVGFKKDRRYYTPKDISSYINNPSKSAVENLSTQDIKEEKVLLGLRSFVGVDIDILNHIEKEKVNVLADQEKVMLKDNIIFNKNYLLSDEIALFILS